MDSSLDITEVKIQSLSTLVTDYFECQKCRVVDKDIKRIRVGFKCPVCEDVSNTARMYFNVNIHTLINLIQESYHSISVKNEGRNESANVSVIIYFCTLRETLLSNLIGCLIKAENLSSNIADRLLSDNKFHIQKQDKLFKSLTKVKWKDAIKKISMSTDFDYHEIDKFVLSVVQARNDFIHRGSGWNIDRELSTNCVKNIWRLVRLYVELHNRYVHPYYK